MYGQVIASARSGVVLSHPSQCETCCPVRNDSREGTHSGALQYAASNVTPCSARRSMFGVAMNG